MIFNRGCILSIFIHFNEIYDEIYLYMILSIIFNQKTTWAIRILSDLKIYSMPQQFIIHICLSTAVWAILFYIE